MLLALRRSERIESRADIGGGKSLGEGIRNRGLPVRGVVRECHLVGLTTGDADLLLVFLGQRERYFRPSPRSSRDGAFDRDDDRDPLARAEAEDDVLGNLDADIVAQGEKFGGERDQGASSVSGRSQPSVGRSVLVDKVGRRIGGRECRPPAAHPLGVVAVFVTEALDQIGFLVGADEPIPQQRADERVHDD